MPGLERELNFMENITIVGFGNSITAATVSLPDETKRWLNILQRKLAETFKDREFNVVNSGVGGNSTREAMARFEKDVLAHNPDYVILEFGGNNNDEKPERRVSFDEFTELLGQYKSGLPPKTRTIPVTFPPVYTSRSQAEKFPSYESYLALFNTHENRRQRFRELLKKFALDNGWPVYDLHADLGRLSQDGGWEKYTLPDCVHLTEAGNSVLAEGVFRVLKEMLRQR